MEFKDDEIKRLQLAAEAEEKKRFLHNIGSLENVPGEALQSTGAETPGTSIAQDPKSPLKQIRTYQGDVASALEHQNESLASIQKREAVKQEAIQKRTPRKSESSSKALILSVFIFIFLALGAGGGYFAYTKYKAQIAAPAVFVPTNRLIPIREERNIDTTDLNRERFINLVREETSKSSSAEQRGEIVQIQLRKGILESSPLLQTSEFLVLMESRAPGSLIRALDPIFMFGLTQNDIGRPFILFKLKSFEQAYPGMLEWEETLREDLLPLFVGSEALINIASENRFQDVTISNKDARILKDNDGKTVLLYTFIDNEILLITDNEISLRTLQNLYSGGKLAR